MRVSLNWLQDLVKVTVAPDLLAETLTMAGFEVEAIEDRRTWADGVVVGRVLQREPHPNADKLSVCQVDVGAESPLQIVCGASNVRGDIFVPVATVGTYLPTIDLKIRPAKLRGVSSSGMICSLAEIGLEKESAGIHIFSDGDLSSGDDVRPLLGLNDVVLDLTSTANRADALSMVGIAREVAALTGASLHLPSPAAIALDENPEVLAVKGIGAACPAYGGTVIEGVKVGPSPLWLQQRLQAAGIRAINNVVDVTNYILLEWGQPLHAFDGDRLKERVGTDGPLVMGVRYARNGETLKTLDGQNRTLGEQALVVTANDRPVALAGVMGGEDTEVHDGTTQVMLEAAIFDSVAIRRSARSQGVRTEASTRYERGVNQVEFSVAWERALDLMVNLTGGRIVGRALVDQRDAQMTQPRSIELRLERIRDVLGSVYREDDLGELQPEEVERILKALGCHIEPVSDSSENGTESDPTEERVWSVTVPFYRYRDLEREIDLIEEVARLFGYDNFCDTLPEKGELGYLPLELSLTAQVREAFRASGMTELLHYSLVKPIAERQVVLANPLLAEYSALRTELLSGLIDAFQFNLQQGNGSLNGFEIGRVFWQDEDGFIEAEAIAGIVGGDPLQGRWVNGGRDYPLTWYEAKGMIESVFQRLGLKVEYQPALQDPRLHPGRTASLWLQGNRLGTFGQLHPQLRQERDLPDAVYGFELDLDLILAFLEQTGTGQTRFQSYSSYPASDRDLALFAPISLAVAEIQRAIVRAGGDLLESVELFDEYRGEGVPEGQRSLGFRLVYRMEDQTLTDEAIEPVHQKVREALEEHFQVSLRS